MVRPRYHGPLFTTDMSWWAGVPVQVLVLLLVLPIGIALWFDADDNLFVLKRLHRS